MKYTMQLWPHANARYQAEATRLARAELEVMLEALCPGAQIGPLPSGAPRRSLISFVQDRLGHDRRYAIDAGKIERELGWRPRFTFEQGIEQTVDWYLRNDAWMAGVLDGSYRQYYEKMYGGK